MTTATETAALRAALSIFLSDFPHDAEPETVLEMVATNDDRVLFWEPVELWPGESLAEAIRDAARAILSEWETPTGGVS